jgi:ketosteroid isomerase-like protein
MSNLSTVNELLTAINFDRFYEIEAHHAPDVVFQSFRGPTLRDSVSVADWHRQFLREYADCNYTDPEYIEEGDVVAVRATIEAKGYDWRPFTQRVVEVFHVEADVVTERRLYGMLRDIELEKPAQQALDAALEVKGGNRNETEQLIRSALEATDAESAAEFYDPKAVLIDSVYGTAVGPENIFGLMAATPRPAFGVERIVHGYPGEHDALVERAIDPSRPRVADWYRIVDGKIRVIERYWMLREIGVNPYVNYARDRHQRQVIMPI